MEVGNRVARSLQIISCGNIVDFRSKDKSVVNEQRANPYIDAKMTYRLDRLVERQSEFFLDIPIFLAGGMGMLVPGAYDLAVDGKCVSAPTPPALTCPTIYSGVPTGAPLVAVGALSIAGGILTLALPGRVFYRPITTISPSPAPPSSPPPPSSGDAPEPAPAPLLKPAPVSGPPP